MFEHLKITNMKVLAVLIILYFLIQNILSLPLSDLEKIESQKQALSEESPVSDKAQLKLQELPTEGSTSNQPTETIQFPIISSNDSLQSQNKSQTDENKLTDPKKSNEVNSSEPLPDSLENSSKPLNDTELPSSVTNLSQNESNKLAEVENSSKPPLNTPENSSNPLNDTKLPSSIVNYINNLSPNASRYFQKRLFPKLVLYPPGTPRGDMLVQMLTVLQQHNLEGIIQSNFRRRKCRRHNHFLFGELENYVLNDIRSIILDFSDVIRQLTTI